MTGGRAGLTLRGPGICHQGCPLFTAMPPSSPSRSLLGPHQMSYRPHGVHLRGEGKQRPAGTLCSVCFARRGSLRELEHCGVGTVTVLGMSQVLETELIRASPVLP